MQKPSPDDSNVSWDDFELTSAFDRQLKLIRKSISNDKETPAKAQTKVKQVKSNVFSNQSKKYRLEDDTTSDNPTSCASANEVPGENKISDAGKECIVPPPSFPQIEDEPEAKASMLMSWYMAGYHTGYFEAMKKFKK